MRNDDIAEALDTPLATVRQALTRRKDLFKSRPDPTDPQEQRKVWTVTDHWWNREDLDHDDLEAPMSKNNIDPQPNDTYETYATRVLGLIDGPCPTCGHEANISYWAIGLMIRPDATGTNWSKPAIMRICTTPRFDEVRSVVERTGLSYEDAATALEHLGELIDGI